MTTEPVEPPQPLHRRLISALRTRRGLAIAAGALALAVGLWVVAARLPGWLRTSTGAPAPPNSTSAPATPPETEARKIRATLYYVSSDGTGLVATTREVPYGATPADQAKEIVAAQVAAPPDGRQSAIPAGTIVRAVFLTGSHDAYVDLGGTIVSGQSGGSLDESLAVYAIVNAVAVNLPDVTAVQILVDGQEVDTLAGHLDLRAPLRESLAWVRKGNQ